VAVDVPNLCAFGALDKERFAAQAAEGADGRIHAAGNTLQGVRE
jgi:hypothetical protein